VTREIANLQVPSFDNPLSSEAVSQLERLLPEYLASQRWYRAKARNIRKLQIVDVVPFTEAYVLIVDVNYVDSDTDSYQLPVTLADDAPEGERVARLRDPSGSERMLSGALSRPEFRNALLDAITAQTTFAGGRGKLVASRTGALERSESDGPLESSVSRAEQSNSSIIYGDRYILKLFRKLESGINPDLEIGRYLTEHQFKHTPPVLGEIEYQPAEGESMHAAILQGFVRNQGDAWKFTLDALAGFFERALQNRSAPTLDTYHPLELSQESLPALARQTVGEYIESARLLGNRTAQMHAALTDESAGPDFAPERFTPEYAEHLHEEMINQADTTFDLLDDKKNMLSGESAESAKQLLASQESIRERFSSLRESNLKAVRIRHHGDYHLGQVLATGDDFVIIDFEGEPARPLAHRRIKTFAMRDVAGMIRSFSYAGYAALFGLVPGVSTTGETRNQIEGWAAYWGAWVSAEYLKAYFETASGAPFVGSDPKEHRLLFDAFMLQKALYEVSYELNNRPDWVQIPLRGILSLIA
jgi:maltose alpha-D-glucosyltransferase / alpha-amylase